MRCGMRYALLAQRGVGAASCRCWCAPIECGPSAACTGELVTRLMCLVCAGTVAAALERMAQPDATEWLYWFWCKPPIGYRQHGLGRELSQLQARSCRRCEHRYRRKWLYLRRACALPMRCGMRYALLAQRGVGAASCRCWCAPIECGPSAACTGELVTRLMCLASWLMCLVCGGAVAAALERTAQPDATEWLWCWCKPIGYRQHGLGRKLSQLQARSSPL